MSKKNLKAMIEKRNLLLAEANGIVDAVEEETRSFEDSELSRMSEIKSEVAGIDATIEQIKEFRSLAATEETEETEEWDVSSVKIVDEFYY